MSAFRLFVADDVREDFKADFGHTFRSNLNGYEDVWNELKEELR